MTMTISDIITNLQIVENNLRELPTGRETSNAITKVQEAIMWAREASEVGPTPYYHTKAPTLEFKCTCIPKQVITSRTHGRGCPYYLGT